MNNIDDISKYLKAIADPTRLKLIEILINKDKSLCVNCLSERLNVTQSALSQHFRILRQLNIVKSNRKGYYIHYEINHEIIDQLYNNLGNILKKN